MKTTIITFEISAYDLSGNFFEAQKTTSYDLVADISGDYERRGYDVEVSKA